MANLGARLAVVIPLTFNVADVYVTLGYALLALGFFCFRRSDTSTPVRAGPGQSQR